MLYLFNVMAAANQVNNHSYISTVFKKSLITDLKSASSINDVDSLKFKA